ncbi:unnamed protein product [Lactuca virosa]|uniref:Uncharacterized protein n=1 Tax=Lactuca virosa TaxID=75947 RepID=A0AAU9LKU2_9ASTR|nr:unnamed protein product [Lactuca virosa]
MYPRGNAPCVNDEDFAFDFEPSDDDFRSFFDFDDVNEVVSAPTETEGDSNILKLSSQSTAQMDEFIAQLHSTARIPPRSVVTLIITPSDRDLGETQASHPPLK